MPESEAESIYTGAATAANGAIEVADETLMLRYAKGDAEAFEELYRRYRGPVFRFLLRSVNGNRAAAEDLFHEVMMKVVGAAKRYTPSAHFNTWLFRIARNACIDLARRKKFEPKHRLSEPTSSESEDVTYEDIVGDSSNSPEDAAIDSETREAVNELLAGMNEEQREVFMLREVEGLTFEEIARVVGCGESTAKSRMRYAMTYLAKGLKERGIVD